MKKKWIISLITIFVVAAILTGPIMSNVEQAKYEVISSDDNIEIRKYSPMIIAEVEVSGQRDQAINEGFNLLADYIFGNNTVQTKINMTAPVEQKSNEKIAMTAPVGQQSSEKGWIVNFVMPSEYSISSLPKPNNETVKLKEIPQKTFVVIRFSGRNSDENLKKYEQKLIAYLEEKKLKQINLPKYAFYNPPWTLPMLRRNEVMIEIENSDQE